uniref:hypothetical protein n=1 Tax=uncultured Nostoc sp. TaxID=340711 RepID=UPI0026097C15
NFSDRTFFTQPHKIALLPPLVGLALLSDQALVMAVIRYLPSPGTDSSLSGAVSNTNKVS